MKQMMRTDEGEGTKLLLTPAWKLGVRPVCEGRCVESQRGPAPQSADWEAGFARGGGIENVLPGRSSVRVGDTCQAVTPGAEGSPMGTLELGQLFRRVSN